MRRKARMGVYGLLILAAAFALSVFIDIAGTDDMFHFPLFTFGALLILGVASLLSELIDEEVNGRWAINLVKIFSVLVKTVILHAFTSDAWLGKSCNDGYGHYLPVLVGSVITVLCIFMYEDLKLVVTLSLLSTVICLAVVSILHHNWVSLAAALVYGLGYCLFRDQYVHCSCQINPKFYIALAIFCVLAAESFKY